MLTLIVTPFFFTSDQNDKIAVSTNLISAIASLITLIVVFLLFDKYGLKKDLIKTQTEVVLQQLESIRTASFLIRSNKGFLQFFPSKSRIESYEIYYSERLIFSKKYWEYINQIFQWSSSIYMPKDIVEKINLLKPATILHLKPEEIDNYSKVTFWSDKSADTDFGKMNGEEITFQNFYVYWIDVIDVINNWLNDKIDINKLNIES